MMTAYSHEVKILEVTLKLHQSNLHEIQAKRILHNKKAERFDLRIQIGDELPSTEKTLTPARPLTRRLRSALKNSNVLISSETLPASLPLSPPPFVVHFGSD
jgi:hypothetical protein